MRTRLIFALCLLPCFLLIHPALAIMQEDLPAPQFLYRLGDQLLLLNAYTGETA